VAVEVEHVGGFDVAVQPAKLDDNQLARRLDVDQAADR
jgi:hypothetical protein